jgi:hypothetical protein
MQARLYKQVEMKKEARSLLNARFHRRINILKDATGLNDIAGFVSLAIVLGNAGPSEMAAISFSTLFSNVDPEKFK